MSQFRKLKSLKFLYEINEEGILRNIKSKKIVRGYIEKNGYVRVRIENKCLGGIVRTSIHQLVAEAFIPNPDNKPFVNHKDLNKQNNHASNLEWVTHKENCKHAYINGAYDEGLKKIKAYRDSTKKRISNGYRTFDSISDAGRWLSENCGIKNKRSGIAGISAVCRGKRHTFGGYHWSYV